MSLRVPPDGGGFLVVPMAFDPGDTFDFTIMVCSDSRIELTQLTS